MSRRDIYYWKCDRPAAFHGTQEQRPLDPQLEPQLLAVLQERLRTPHIKLSPAATQGNHLTWNADVAGEAMFVRVENGPEQDEQLAIESQVMATVAATGVRVPKVFAVDASRSQVPFAWQVMERIPFPDLNHWHKAGTLAHSRIAFDIGAAVATWQTIQPTGFGPLALSDAPGKSDLVGLHGRYADYFHLRLEQHLSFLVEKQFLSREQRLDIEQAIAAHQPLLQLDHGCLVHKDLALWNILGSEDHIAAFIDFDDAISGDPMDDLSLLACFHDAAFLTQAFEGFQTIRPLPEHHRQRFWLHLLRNMIVKAVIRVGAGYFDRSDGFFLIGAGSSGADLRRVTHERIALALHGLRTDGDLSLLKP